VAVANAIPAIAAGADLVTRAADGAGVIELIDGSLLSDMAGYGG
jgi:hydroxymethylpyrimidine pyrophosphatase-like HAD family hydrolase